MKMILLLSTAALVVGGTIWWAATPSKPVTPSGVQASGPQAAPPPAIYADLNACKAEHTETECNAAFTQAQAQSEKSAPRFTAAATCEDRYGAGNCVPRHTESGDVFMPMMMGFMIGHAFGGGGYAYQPVFIDRDRRAYGGGGTVIVNNYGGAYRSSLGTVPASTSTSFLGGGRGIGPSTSPAMAPSVSARAGFGASASTAAVSAGS